jgi:hypothetical protein
MECEQVVLTLILPDVAVSDILAFVYGGSEAGTFDLPGTKCVIEWEHAVLTLVGLPDVPSVSVASPLGAISETIDVGNGSYVNEGSTREVVPEGQIQMPEMVHGSVGCGQMIIGALRDEAL